MLRTEAQVALDDVQRACRRLAELYADDAQLLEHSPAAQRLRELAGERGALAERVADEQRRLGDLPSGTDEDRTSLSELKDRLQAHLPGAGAGAVLESRLHDERALSRLAEDALSEQLPEHAARVLEQVRATSAQAQERLRAMLEAP